jgi:hypothetical protein
MKHYVVINDWACYNESGIEILGVAHSYNEAVSIVGAHLAAEKKHAEANYHDAIIETDDESYFEAYEDGYYNDNHTKIEIQEVND